MKRREREIRGVLQVEISSVIRQDEGAIVVSSRALVPLVGGNFVVRSGGLRAGTLEAPTTLVGWVGMSS